MFWQESAHERGAGGIGKDRKPLDDVHDQEGRIPADEMKGKYKCRLQPGIDRQVHVIFRQDFPVQHVLDGRAPDSHIRFVVGEGGEDQKKYQPDDPDGEQGRMLGPLTDPWQDARAFLEPEPGNGGVEQCGENGDEIGWHGKAPQL